MIRILKIYYGICKIGLFVGILSGYLVVMPYCLYKPAPEPPRWLIVWGIATMWCLASFIWILIALESEVK